MIFRRWLFVSTRSRTPRRHPASQLRHPTCPAGRLQTIDRKEPFWQPRYYPFNLYSEKKATEKLDYMHLNPVRAGLVDKAVDWAWNSARYFDSGKSVGVPLEWIFS